MATAKSKHAFWLTDEAKTMVEIDFQLDNCGSQSEFVEKAIRFYDGYVHANKTGAYLPRALQEIPWRIWATMWSACVRRGRTGTMTCGQGVAK